MNNLYENIHALKFRIYLIITKQMKLLIIEDEKDLRKSIVSYLSEEGYTCEDAEDFEQGIEKINKGRFDCFIIDIMLPKGTGLDLIKHIKNKSSDSGIIIVSAKNSLEDKLTGLEHGADDYISKPFHLSELNARIKSLIRRRSYKKNDVVILNEIKILPNARQVFINEEEIILTAKEYDLLLFFISNKGRVLPKDSIAEHLGSSNTYQENSFDFIYTHLSNLRKKLIEAGAKDYISTVYGIGYKFLVK
jgi:DNA-binding response OmpR family regulator